MIQSLSANPSHAHSEEWMDFKSHSLTSVSITLPRLVLIMFLTDVRMEKHNYFYSACLRNFSIY